VRIVRQRILMRGEPEWLLVFRDRIER